MVKSSRFRGMALLAGLFFGACPACALVLDFQDAVDMKKASNVDVAQHPTGAQTSAADGAADAPRNATRDSAGDTARDASAPPRPDAAAPAPNVVVPSPARTCVPAPAADWTGPLVIHEASGSSTTTLPAGEGAFATPFYDGFASPLAAAADCTCTCGAPADVTCSAPTITLYSDRSCTQACGAGQSLAAAPACTPLASPGNNNDGENGSGCQATRLRLGGSAATGGDCAPSATVTIAPPTWTAAVRLCTSDVAPAACGAGQIAVPPAASGFQQSNYCVARAGEWECPSGYPSKRTYHESAADTRSCTSCGCGAPTGASCSAPTLFTDNACGGTPQVTRAGACDAIGNAKGASFSEAATGGACAPSGGMPTGTVTPTAPTTICCAR